MFTSQGILNLFKIILQGRFQDREAQKTRGSLWAENTEVKIDASKNHTDP